jgi:hypothetical protein
MSPFLFGAIFNVLHRARKIVCTKKPTLSTFFIPHKGFDNLPPHELMEESCTLLAKWWLWWHNRKKK